MGARRSHPLGHLRLVDADDAARSVAAPPFDDDPWAGEDDPAPEQAAPDVHAHAPDESPLALGRAVVVGVLVSIPIWMLIIGLGFMLAGAL